VNVSNCTLGNVEAAHSNEGRCEVPRRATQQILPRIT